MNFINKVQFDKLTISTAALSGGTTAAIVTGASVPVIAAGTLLGVIVVVGYRILDAKMAEKMSANPTKLKAALIKYVPKGILLTAAATSLVALLLLKVSSLAAIGIAIGSGTAALCPLVALTEKTQPEKKQLELNDDPKPKPPIPEPIKDPAPEPPKKLIPEEKPEPPQPEIESEEDLDIEEVVSPNKTVLKLPKALIEMIKEDQLLQDQIDLLKDGFDDELSEEEGTVRSEYSSSEDDESSEEIIFNR